MEKIIEAVAAAIERILHSINSAQKMGVIVTLTLLFACLYLLYQLSQSQELVASIIEPRIEKVGGYCYQQQIRGRRLIAIQFPIEKDMIALGVEQNLSAFLLSSDTKNIQFNKLCDGLVTSILDPAAEAGLLFGNPQWKKDLQEYYRSLDKPVTDAVPILTPPLKNAPQLPTR